MDTAVTVWVVTADSKYADVGITVKAVCGTKEAAEEYVRRHEPRKDTLESWMDPIHDIEEFVVD